MRRFPRVLAATVASAGLAVAAGGCGTSVIGDDGPHHPNLAAEVEGDELTLDELDEMTDSFCALIVAEQSGAVSRANLTDQLLQGWIGSTIYREFAEEEGLQVTPQQQDLESSPGWAEISEEQQQVVADYLAGTALAEAVAAEVGPEGQPSPADYDTVINPRFDLSLGEESFEVGDVRLSVAVSDEATAEDEEDLTSLPEDEVCGTPGPPTGA